MAQPRGLGKGLEALIQGYSDADSQVREETSQSTFFDGENEKVYQINLSSIKPNREQPRKDFDQEKLEQLADSIRQSGVIQPIIVTPDGEFYTIVAGERRFRAAMKAGLSTIPAIIRRFDDQELLQVALIENIQREDLNDIDMANAYRELHDRFGLTQEEIADKVGKSRGAVANTMRLLNLNEDIQALIKNGRLSAGHAKAILSVSDESDRTEFAQLIVKKGLNVRDAEKKAKTYSEKKRTDEPFVVRIVEEQTKTPYMRQLEDELSEYVGSRVTINSKGKNGTVEIEYYNEDDLDRIIELLRSIQN